MSHVVPPFKKHFCDSSPHLAKSLRECIQNDFDTSDRNKTICLKCYHVYNILLPDLSQHPDGFRHFYMLNIVDADIRQDLQDNKIINWCRTGRTLYPLKTKGDGNCLLHAVSLCMWGLEDDELLLRRLLYVSLVQDTTSHKNFQRRWLLRQRRLNFDRPTGFNTQLDSNEIEREWETITNTAIDQEHTGTFLSYHTLEAVHLYVLSNILRRPIIVLANKTVRSVYGNSVQECNLSGIYLPLEWKSEDTYHTPILLGYSMNHFVPLITKQSSDNDGEPFIPLVFSDFTQLIVQFLLPDEEHIVQDLINMYLKTKSVHMTTQDSVIEIPVAKLEFQRIQDHHDLVQDHLCDCLQIFGIWSNDPSRTPRTQAPPVFVNNEIRYVDNEQGIIRCEGKCLNEGCEMHGTQSLAGYCYKCVMDYTNEYKEKEEEMAAICRQQDLQPTAPPASIPRQAYDMSMMDVQCQRNCGNRASTKTFPFCHECHPNERQGQPPSSLPVSIQAVCDPIDDQSLFGGGQDRTPPRSNNKLNSSFTKLQPGQQPEKLCSSQSCKETCLTLQANKCAKCFILTGHTDFQNEAMHQTRPSSRLSNSSGRSEPSSQTYVLNDLSGARNPPALRSVRPEDLSCKTEGCKNPPHFHKDGFCDECAKKRQPKLRPTYPSRIQDPREDKVVQTSLVQMNQQGRNICLTPGCLNPVVQGGLCQKCVLFGHRRLESIDLENIEVSATPCEMPPPEEVNPVITSHKDKIKCASPLCQSLIYPPNKICEACTAILSEAHARSRSTEHRRLSPVQHGSCYSPSRQRCKSTGCHYYGDPRTHGYCSKCYEKDKKDKMRPLRAPQVNKGQICVEPNCDKYGDQSMNYRCTFHYNFYKNLYAGNLETTNLPARTTPSGVIPGPQTHVPTRTQFLNFNQTYPPAPSTSSLGHQFPMLPSQIERYNVPEREPMNNLSKPSTPGVEQKYNQAMSKVEQARKNIRHCKTQGCNNYGNSQKEGYCNSCYSEIQRQRLMGSPQYGDSYCC